MVVPIGKVVSFDDLLQRNSSGGFLHQALVVGKSGLLAFDILKRGNASLAGTPLTKRGSKLEELAAH